MKARFVSTDSWFLLPGTTQHSGDGRRIAIQCTVRSSQSSAQTGREPKRHTAPMSTKKSKQVDTKLCKNTGINSEKTKREASKMCKLDSRHSTEGHSQLSLELGLHHSIDSTQNAFIISSRFLLFMISSVWATSTPKS